MHLIVGLGNPGSEYAANRHNVGFHCINRLARECGIALKQRKWRSRIGLGRIEGREIVLAKPATYMNLSGEAVKLLMRQYDIPLAGLVVVHDDMDLSLGKLRLRQGARAGGHKGAASIIAALGSHDFVRLRIGIGRPERAEGGKAAGGEKVVDFVLGDFTPADLEIVEGAIDRAVEAIRCLLTEGVTVAMNRYN
jgi:peptidyl-tRNA hydrolase, PTH1 family